MSKNRAAWIITPGKVFSISAAPTYKPKAGEVLIKTAAVAMNPIDWKKPDASTYSNLYPFILGRNTAGTVEDVGRGATRFYRGQRVMPKTGYYANSAFQLYSLASERFIAVIPDSISFEKAAVLPLSISTAAAGLYLPENLNLPLPSTTSRASPKALLIWGGASSVGSTTIQLAAASGLKVVITASSANHEYVRSLGASAVLDYRSPSLIVDLLSELKGGDFVGIYDAIGEEQSFAPLKEIVRQLHGPANILSTLPCDSQTDEFRPSFGTSDPLLRIHDKIGEAVWGFFVPKGLVNGQLKPKPDPLVVGHGLEMNQTGVDRQKEGVSAKRIVVTI
ncbi:chaperonin 10-like protein [Cadophora sp. MPI-SDFR-AT-0126]|nr:chaperonin 10-like protein [Leotiomycetes sp. MPI-SDFR-AT-0126]